MVKHLAQAWCRGSAGGTPHLRFKEKTEMIRGGGGGEGKRIFS